MKRIRCPKCEEFIRFDETKYADGQSLVFTCEACGKQFSIRIGKRSTAADQDDAMPQLPKLPAHLQVIENQFAQPQTLSITSGDNVVGRRCVGTRIQAPIDTGDMSMDRRHCIVTATTNPQGITKYTLRDGPSLTGTWHMNEILGVKDRIILHQSDIITIGATTLIFHNPEEEQ